MDQKETDILIYEDTDYENNPIRVYDGGSSWQSATFVDENKKYDLVFQYMKTFDLALQSDCDARRILLMGGAGFAYPKHVLAHHPEVKIDVVDIDPMAVETAEKFFYLTDAVKEFDPEGKRFHSHVDDGLRFLQNSETEYDVIINDAYNDLEPAYHLLTYEAAFTVKSKLDGNGIYVINLSADRKPQRTEYLADVVKTLKEVFANVIVVRAFNFPHLRTGNYVLFCSERELSYEKAVEIDVSQAVTIRESNIEELKEKFVRFMERL